MLRSGLPKGNTTRFGLLDFIVTIKPMGGSLVYIQAHVPQTLSKVNPSKAMMSQMIEIKGIFPQLIDDTDSRVIKMKIKNGEHL